MVNTIFFLIRGGVCDKYDFVKPHFYAVKLVGTGQKDPTTNPIGYAIAL